jgi:hypothetical protein
MANATFNVQTNLRFVANDFVKVIATASPANYVYGRVVSYTAGTGTLIITPLQSVGTGTFSAWTVELTGKNGTSGASASSGTSGTSSSSASSGTQGTSATSGSSGTSGSAGTSASSGSSGTSASSGSSGTSAVQGGTGPQGATGPQGPTGLGGSSGTSGSSGGPGPQGPIGAQGPQGPQGFAGATGPTGSPGPQGPTGSSASYNQDNNSGASVTFTQPTTTGTWSSSYRFYMPGDAYIGIGGSYGPVWFGFNFGWASNAGLGGAYFFNSSTRSMKKDIEPFTKDATEIIKSTEIVTWDFESGEHTQIEHIGFIAEDTPEELSTPSHDVMDITNTVGVVLKAIQEIDDRITALQNKNNNG